ncbi:MAG: hypothetical protein OXF02_05145 [Simkaniaceae bacterium]|nr:hypothetical protein [Simkaniaceae bacterium]
MFLRKLHQHIKMKREIYFSGRMNAEIKDGSAELVDFSEGLEEDVLRFLGRAMREGVLFARKYTHRHKGGMWFVVFSADLPKYMVHCFPFLTEAVQENLMKMLFAFTKAYRISLPEQVDDGGKEEVLWKYKEKEFRFGRRLIEVAQISKRDPNPKGPDGLSDRSRRSLAYGDFR